MYKIYKIIVLLCFANLAHGATQRELPGLGSVARNMLEPVMVASSFVEEGCFLIGGSFLFAALIKYFEHRRSPLMVPISTVVFLVVSGIILIALPFLSYVVPTAISYH